MSGDDGTLLEELGPSNESLTLDSTTLCHPSMPQTSQEVQEEEPNSDALVLVDNQDGIVEALDKIGDLCQHKNKEKKDSASKHVTTFLQKHFVAKHENYTNVKKCVDIPYQMLKDEQDFFDRLATYFAEHARHKGQDPPAPLLSMNSADGYFSAAKMFLIVKYENEKAVDLPCFAPTKWKRLRDGIISIKTDQAQRLGTKLFNGAELADDDDVNSLGTVCLWEGTSKGVAFYAFNKLTYHLIARCCEGAAQQKHEIEVVKTQLPRQTNRILRFTLKRTKTRKMQYPVAFAHKNKFLWDLYFALAMHLIVQPDASSRPLFPDFFKHLSVKNYGGKGDSSESKASNLWNKYYKELMGIASQYKGGEKQKYYHMLNFHFSIK